MCIMYHWVGMIEADFKDFILELRLELPLILAQFYLYRKMVKL